MTEQFHENFFEQEFENLNDHTTSAIERIKTEYQAIDGMHENATYWMIAVLCEFGNRLKSSPDLKRWLLSHEFWSNSPRPPREDTIFRVAARFLLGARNTKSPAYEKARSYAQVAEYFVGLRVKPKDVVAKLKELKMKTILNMAGNSKEDVDEASGGRPERRSGIDATGRTVNRKGSVARPKRSESESTANRHFNRPGEENADFYRRGDSALRPRQGEVRNDLGNASKQGHKSSAHEASDDDEVVILTGDYADDFDEVAEGEQIVVTLRRERSEDRQPLFRVENVEFLDDADEGSGDSLRETNYHRLPRRTVNGVNNRNRGGPPLIPRSVPARTTSRGRGR